MSITLPSCNTLGTAYLLVLHILNSGNQTNTLPRPLFAFRRNKNLENSWVKSVLPGSKVLVQRSITGSNPICATHKCGNCHACDFAMVSPELEWGKKKFLFKEMTNCRTANVVYLILCPCKKGYFGETSREFRVRFSEHKSAIRNKWLGAPMVTHWLDQQHSVQDPKWMILEQN